MQVLKIIAIMVTVALTSSSVFAAHHTREERGKALFNDPKLGGGTSGKSCATCHFDGKGLYGVGDKKQWKNPGGTFNTLEDVVNMCIVMALRGRPLDVKSEQMKDLMAYLKSFKAKRAEAPAKKPAVGC
jgi:cytochrome c5